MEKNKKIFILVMFLCGFIYVLTQIFSGQPINKPSENITAAHETKEQEPIQNPFIVSIPSIAKKDNKTVESILGPSEECHDIKFSTKDSDKTQKGKNCSYKNGKIEIVYINEKADWITVNNMNDVSYTPDSIKILGLDPEEPSFHNEYNMRWDNKFNLVSVQLHPAGHNIAYAYIKALTE